MDLLTDLHTDATTSCNNQLVNPDPTLADLNCAAVAHSGDQRVQTAGYRAALPRDWCQVARIFKLAHAFRREYSHERLKLVQLLGQLGVFFTCASCS